MQPPQGTPSSETIQQDRWSLRDAAWAVCLHAGLTSLIFNAGSILKTAGRLLSGAGAAAAGEALTGVGGMYPSGLTAFSSVLSAVVVLWAAKRTGISVVSFGFRRPEAGAAWTAAFTALLAVLYLSAGTVMVFAMSGPARSLIPAEIIRRMGLPWTVAAFCVSAPLGEETVYRGMLYRPLRKRLGTRGAIVLSALIFALMHNLMYWSLFPPITQFLGGLVLAYAFEKTGSLIHPVVYHSLGNALLFAGYLMLFT